MGEIVKRRGENVYRDRNWLVVLVGIVFAGAGVCVMCASLPDILADGGMKLYQGHHDNWDSNAPYTWIPEVYAVPLVIAFCSIFVVVGLALLLYALNGRIVTDADGISQFNLFGKRKVRARWDEVVAVSVDTRGRQPSTQVITARGRILFYDSSPWSGSLLQDVREHSGHAPTNPDAEAAVATRPPPYGATETPGHQAPAAAPAQDPRFLPDPQPQPAAPFAESSLAGSQPEVAHHVVAEPIEETRTRTVRPERVFGYKFPWMTVFSCSPLFVMGVIFMVHSKAPAGAWPVLFVLFGLPVVLIGCTAVSAVNGKVIMKPDRLIIMDGLGRETFNARWDDVTGVFFESRVTSDGGGSPVLGYYRTYRVEAGAAKAKFRSSLRNFEECLHEMRVRVPATAIVAC
jgi:hypothetical protein